ALFLSQRTPASEIEAWLEFRRGLFRSLGKQADDGRPAHGLEQAVGRPQQGHGPRRGNAHPKVAPRRKSQPQGDHPKGGSLLAEGSEERRGGKESRQREEGEGEHTQWRR